MKLWCVWSAALVLLATGARAEETEFVRRATWAAPSSSQVKAEVDRYLAGKSLDDLSRAKIDAIWSKEFDNIDVPLLERVAATVALADPKTADVVSVCRHGRLPDRPAKFKVLADESVAPLARNNLRLLYGRLLAEREFYDEARDLLTGLEVGDVVDPASLLFYQSVVAYQSLDKETCLPTVDRLLENERAAPRRYLVVAQLMAADLRPLKEGSLDEIARLMADIRRRLGHAEAGAKVRSVQIEVVEKLDRLIEEDEGDGPRTPRPPNPPTPSKPTEPAPDSFPGGAKGRGDVDLAKLPTGKQWRDLPPAEREAVLQQITKDLPAHYREVIEAYFRRLARDGVK